MRDAAKRDGAPSPRATRIGLLVLVPVAVVLGVQTISWAVPKVWTHGETLTADDLNRDFKALDDSIAAVAATIQPSPWVECGTFESLRNGTAKCEVNGYPVDQYEYGFKYNSPEVHVADCLQWNFGLRIVNRSPYMVNSDDPTNAAMQLGGAIWYTETSATDDDIPAACPSGTWRHHYWQIMGGSVSLLGGNGCFSLKLYCRRR